MSEFQRTSGVPKWLLRFCQGIFKTINSISSLEVLWMEIVANKKNENQLQVPVLQYSCIVDFLTSVISTQVFFPEKWRTKQSLK